jgi:hypothetical protein
LFYSVPGVPASPIFTWSNFARRKGVVSWDPPSYDGGAAVTSFEVDMMIDDLDDDFTSVYSGPEKNVRFPQHDYKERHK